MTIMPFLHGKLSENVYMLNNQRCIWSMIEPQNLKVILYLF